jgi:hypothetical protein
LCDLLVSPWTQVAHTLEITPARRSSEREIEMGAPAVTEEGPPAVSFCDKRRTEAVGATLTSSSGSGSPEQLPLFWLDFCRLTNGNHSQLEIALLSPDVCAEWGLLQAILEWVKDGTMTEPPQRRFPGSDDVVVRDTERQRERDTPRHRTREREAPCTGLKCCEMPSTLTIRFSSSR